MPNQLNSDVENAVNAIFKQKEEEAMREETEKALQKSADKIDELASSLEAKDKEVSDLEEVVSQKEDTIAGLETKVKELEEKIESLESGFEEEKANLVKRADDAEKELENIRKDQLAQARFGELKNSGVAATSEKAVEDQTAKIREMSDEDFTAYKDELTAIREAIVAELKTSDDASSEDADADEGGTEDADADNNEDADADKGDTEDADADEEDAAADEDTMDLSKATAAALNLEIKPGADVLAKYRELGEQMAKSMRGE